MLGGGAMRQSSDAVMADCIAAPVRAMLMGPGVQIIEALNYFLHQYETDPAVQMAGMAVVDAFLDSGTFSLFLSACVCVYLYS
jgi:hypothetical protein